MAEVQVGQLPIFTIADTPDIVGVNDGTIWAASNLRFVGLYTDATRQDRAGAMNTPTSGAPIAGARIEASASYDSTDTPGALRWTVTGLGAVSWAMSGRFDFPLPDSTRYYAQWVFADADPTVTYSGAFAGGIDWDQLTTDLAAGDVRIDAFTDTAPVYTQTSLHIFQMWVTEGAAETVRVLRQYPRHDAHGFGNTGRIYPRPSGARNYGGQP